MIAAVSGSRHPINARQLRWLEYELLFADGLRHGGCTGADEASHRIFLPTGKHIWVHPAKGVSAVWISSFCLVPAPNVTVLPAAPPVDRSHTYIDASDVLLLLPDKKPTLRSGTWAAFRHAERTGKPAKICY